jgi:hypothetical protein
MIGFGPIELDGIGLELPGYRCIGRQWKIERKRQQNIYFLAALNG